MTTLNTIITNLQTLLRTITVANGYNTTVASVSTTDRIMMQTPPGDFPALDIVLGDEDMIHGPVEICDAEHRIFIRGQVMGISLTNMRLLKEDVQNCLATDHTLGGTVIDIVPVRAGDDGGTWRNSAFEIECIARYEFNYGFL